MNVLRKMLPGFVHSRLMLRHFGARWLCSRIWYLASQKAGLLEYRMKPVMWDQVPLASFLSDPALASPEAYVAWRQTNPAPFFFQPKDRARYQALLAQWDQDSKKPAQEATEIMHGRLKLFGHRRIPTGFPPDWHKNPLTSHTIPFSIHWSRINEFAYGDIKAVWELSRFSFVYPLVRAYWRSRDEAYPEAFWKALESWREANPPNSGVNWKCGQEISLRLMAWIFGLYGFLHAPATSPERVASLAQMIAVSGQRIFRNISYALSQRNNHGISEAVALWTIGLLFPEFSNAQEWKALGKTLIEGEGQRLVYDDGAFSQHSLNYHRLMLHDYLWAIRLGDLSGNSLSRDLKERIEKAGEFLSGLLDHDSGKGPNYGHNDGSLILPLTNCDYGDYRPIIQSAWICFKGKRCFKKGPWDEEVLWLFGPGALDAEADALGQADLSAVTGGYYTLRSEKGFAFIRCSSFIDRPGQADMLHADIWWRGLNVAVDAGTYSYNAPAPWGNALARTAYHNTITVDGRDQMDQAGRFIWLPWLRARVDTASQSDAAALAYMEGHHDGYTRLKPPVAYRRGLLRIGPEHWLVLDALSSPGIHEYRLQWLLADAPYLFEEKEGAIELSYNGRRYRVKVGGNGSEIEYSLMRADPLTPRGWVSEHYYDLEPALSFVAAVHSPQQLFYTILGPDPVTITMENNTLDLEGELWKCLVELHVPALNSSSESRPIVSRATLSGSITDRLYCG